MEFLQKPPPWLTNLLPESARDLLNGGGWWVVLGFFALALLLVVFAMLGRITRALVGRRPTPPPKENLEEVLASYPPLTAPPSKQRLTYEGLPVRLRLVVLAPAGKDAVIDPQTVFQLLDRVLPGLGAVGKHDQARVRIWPARHSFEGFGVTFHRNTPLPEGENQPSHWIPLAGRVKLGTQSVLLGLALWTTEKSTLARRTLEPHQWPLALRIKPHAD
jgi:hypothetical protein